MVALLYDIHGNLVALDAVLADAERRGVKEFLLGGDYCAFGPQPEQVLERLKELPASTIWLRGNTERWIADPAAVDIPSQILRDAVLFTADAIGRPSVAELSTLPHVLSDVPFEGAAMTIFCHASPGSDMIGFTDQPADSDGAAAASSIEANTIVCGHTHIQFARTVGVIEVVNPGSVGFPFDGDQRAAYALLGDDGSFELCHVEYDVDAAIASFGDHQGEWVELGKRRLREARP